MRRIVGSIASATLYPVVGVVLAMGAPGGLLVLRVVTSPLPPFAAAFAAVSTDFGTFVYVGVSTSIAFAVLGRVLGHTVDRLRESSITDPLTGLFNRRHFRDRLTQELERATRYGTPLALLLVDVDGLKRINDVGGHEAGDAAIRTVARALESTSRATDVAARIGGDEFAVLAPGVTAEGASELAARIRTALRALGEPHGSSPTVSVGVTDASRAGAAAEKMYSSADAALYDAKSGGRDRAVLSTSAR